MQAFLFQMTENEMNPKEVQQIMSAIKPGHKGVVTGEDIKSYVIKNHAHAPNPSEAAHDHSAVDLTLNNATGGEKAGPVRVKVSHFQVFVTLLRRAIAKKIRLWVNMVTAVFLILFTSFITGAMTSSSYLAAAWISQTLQVQLILALIMVVCSMNVLGADRVILIRETKTGTPTILIYLSLITVHLLDIFLLPLIFTLVFYGFVFPEIDFRSENMLSSSSLLPLSLYAS